MVNFNIFLDFFFRLFYLLFFTFLFWFCVRNYILCDSCKSFWGIYFIDTLFYMYSQIVLALFSFNWYRLTSWHGFHVHHAHNGIRWTGVCVCLIHSIRLNGFYPHKSNVNTFIISELYECIQRCILLLRATFWRWHVDLSMEWVCSFTIRFQKK